MFTTSRPWPFVVAAFLLMSAAAGLCGEPANLVANGDFSRVAAGSPVDWAKSGDANVRQSLEVREEAGNRYARLTCTAIERKGPASHAMIAQVGKVSLEKGKTYEFSCRARVENLAGRSVSVAISDTKAWANCGLRSGLALSRRWKTFRRVFRAASTVSASTRLQLWYGEPGTLCLDDVRIVEVSEATVALADVIGPAPRRNLVPNGSFEAGGSGWSSIGRGCGWGNLSRLHGEVLTGGRAPHGRSFLRIPLGGDSTPVMHFDYLRPVVHRELRPLAAGLGWIPVEKGSRYTLSCYMRSSVAGVKALVGVRSKNAADPSGSWPGLTQKKEFRLATGWRRYTFAFRPSRSYVAVRIGPELDEERPVTVDLDAVQLEKSASPTEFAPRAAVEWGAAASAPGGIFTVGDEAAGVSLRACNHGGEAARAGFSLKARDFFDEEARLAPVAALNVRPGASAETVVKIPPEWRGHYRIEVTCRAAGLEEKKILRVAVVPKRARTETVLGINHAFVSPYLIDLAKKCGVTWYRDWTLKWQDIEPREGDYRWEVGDTQIDRVIKAGVKLMALLPPFGSANWSSEAPAGIPTKGYPGSRLREAWGPKEPAKLGGYVEKVSRRYRGRVDVWEFLNEPINTDYSLPGRKHKGKYPEPLYEVADYVRLLGVAAAGMRKGNRDCKVMGGLGAGPTGTTLELVKAGVLRHCDLFDLHAYPGAKTPESFLAEMDGLLGLMDRHGGRRPIWFTEFSYYGVDDLPRRPFIPGRGWAANRLLESERQCAEYTVRFMAVMLARNVERLFIHSGASGIANEGQFECCLFGYGGEPRKVFPAVAVFTELMGPKPKLVGERRFGTAGHAFAFETGGSSVVILWEADEDAETELTAWPRGPGGARPIDFMGRELQPPRLMLGVAPVYLVGGPGRAGRTLRGLALAGK